MIVCIAEKPSVAQDIAKVIGATKRPNGYYEGNGYQVTWTYGHLCCLKAPEEYNEQWKKWSLSSLPMIPERFGINLIADSGVKKQFAIIKKLFASAAMIINCGDAGQEGELIQRWVMQKAQVKYPVKRLWISSLTEEAELRVAGKIRGVDTMPVDHKTFREVEVDETVNQFNVKVIKTRSVAILDIGDGISRNLKSTCKSHITIIKRFDMRFNLFPFVLESCSIRQEAVFTLLTKGHLCRTAFGRFVLKMSGIRFQSQL